MKSIYCLSEDKPSTDEDRNGSIPLSKLRNGQIILNSLVRWELLPRKIEISNDIASVSNLDQLLNKHRQARSHSRACSPNCSFCYSIFLLLLQNAHRRPDTHTDGFKLVSQTFRVDNT